MIALPCLVVVLYTRAALIT